MVFSQRHRDPHKQGVGRPRGARASLAVGTSLALTLIATGIGIPVAATAAPAASAQTNSFRTAGAFSGTVPDGVCTVVATVTGGAGGSAASASSSGQTANANGRAAQITGTFSVQPGQEFSGAVGGGGAQDGVQSGGSFNGGGAGNGSGTHNGASGGGYSVLSFDDEDPSIIAGGGGGSGGGHPDRNNMFGMGGDAGLPTKVGETAAGNKGTDGKDKEFTKYTVTAGQGGGSTAGGAGGTNSGDTKRNGEDGAQYQGGAGGWDDTADGSGGGGGGVYGGGGGASTIGEYNSVPGVTGGGGGGGSSFVSDSASAVSSEAVGYLSRAGKGDDGSVSLDWVMCDYDLSITKSAVDNDARDDATLIGSTITWTIAVTNEGPHAMTKGDTVTISDQVPGAGVTKITNISTTGGSSDLFESGDVTCENAAIGSVLPEVLTCSRPFALSGASEDGVRGLNVGETLTVTYTQTVTDEVNAVLENTASVTDRTEGDTNDTATASTTVTADPPAAKNDSDLKNELGTAVTVDVVDNDERGTGKLVPSSVKLIDPKTEKPIGGSYTVPDQGTWSVGGKGEITFTPLDTFFGDPAPIGYQVSDENGLTGNATVTVTYVPEAADDEDLNNTIGESVPVSVIGNDKGAFDASSVRILDGTTPVTVLKVKGEGTWTVNTDTGLITFTPEDGFEGDPTPISYELADQKGAQVTAKVTVTYLAVAANDAKLDNAIGTDVTVPVLDNDLGIIAPESVRIVSGGDRVTELTVDGEGTWTVDEKTGDITFSPEDDFEGDPTPIAYEATDTKGDVVSADVTVTYKPAALNDEDLENTLGEAVDVSVIANDAGIFDTSTVRLLDNGSDPVESLIVSGEGIWTVEGGGVVRFTPEDGFLGDPTPISYSVAGQRGVVVTATVTVEYLPQAKADAHTGNTIGDSVTVDVLANDADTGIFDPTSVRITDGTTAVTELVVEGEGTWTVDTKTGRITFAPEDGFLVDPTPITYQVTDTTGDTVSTQVAVEYLPQAADDEDLGNKIGETVDVTVLGNDTGDFEAASVRILDGTTAVSELVVSGEGTWTIEDGGVIRFTPEAGFLGDPTTIGYQVADVTGDIVSAHVTVAYVPEAVADASHGNVIGQPVTVDVVNSDTGDLDPASVRIIDPTNNARVLSLTVAGQGAWNVDPATGEITFTPEAGFEGNPTPIVYEVTDRTGDTVSASVIVSYLPEAADDVNSGNTEGEAVTVNVLGNDTGVFDPTSVMLIDPDTKELTKSLTVDGEGVWSVNPETGAITFTPEAGFIGDPTPVSYQVTDLSGNVTTADVTIQYVHPEAPAAVALPVTGADVLAPLTIGVVVLLLGGAALLIARRRNTEN